MSRIVLSIASLALLLIATPDVDAGLHTYYQENFNDDGGDGVRGPSPPNPDTFDNGNWDIDATGANLLNSNDFAFVNGSSFQFRDLGGSTGTGVAVFETVESAIFVGNPANFTFLQMTLFAGLSGASAGSDLVIESIINDVVVETTTLTAAGNTVVTHNLLDDIAGFSNETIQYELRVTATMDTNLPTFFIDNIFVQGNTTPEPASMSLLGVGLLAMCGAGYRRRRNAPSDPECRSTDLRGGH